MNGSMVIILFLSIVSGANICLHNYGTATFTILMCVYCIVMSAIDYAKDEL